MEKHNDWGWLVVIWLVVSNLFFPQYMGQSFPLTNIFQTTNQLWLTTNYV